MDFKEVEEILAAIATYEKQAANGEDELPQNSDLLVAVQNLVGTNPRLFTALDTLGVDYIECVSFKYFKADDDFTGNESLFFISPNLTLTLKDSYL